MCVRYNGEVSSFKSCPGGGPQGGLLTGVLFILQVNKAGAPCVQQEENQTRLEVAVEHIQWMEEENEWIEVAVEDAQWMEHNEESSSRLEEAEEYT